MVKNVYGIEKSKIMKIKNYDEEIFMFKWTLIISEKEKDKSKIDKILKNRDCEIEGVGEANGFTLHRNWEFIIILNTWKKDMKDLTYLLSVVRHEVHHLCADVYSNIGEDINVLDAESFLYFNDYIFRKILNSKAFGKVVDKL